MQVTVKERMTEHAPGPWTWTHATKDCTHFDDEECDHDPGWTGHGPDLWSGNNAVLSSWGHDAWGLTVKRADALLIAAAPDLLQALKMVLANDMLSDGSHDWRTCDQPSCLMARLAIEKAEGAEKTGEGGEG